MNIHSVDLDGVEDESVDPFAIVAAKLDHEAVRAVLRELGERDGRSVQIIKSQYGFDDDTPKSYEAVGKEFGITRERVRQISARTLSKLRSNDIGSRLKSAVRGASDPSTDLTAEPCDPPTVPMLYTPQRPRIIYGRHELERSAKNCIFRAITGKPKSFKRTHASLLVCPVEVLADIKEYSDNMVTAEHAEKVWNEQLPQIVEKLSQENSNNFSLDKLSLLFSALLADTMRSHSRIMLYVPEILQGKINFLGAGLQRGALSIVGNLGRNIGKGAHGTAEIKIYGNVGDNFGRDAHGYAHLIANESGDNLGLGLHDEARITAVSAGKNVGKEARSGTIRIHTTAKSITRLSTFRGTITTGSPSPIRTIHLDERQ